MESVKLFEDEHSFTERRRGTDIPIDYRRLFSLYHNGKFEFTIKKNNIDRTFTAKFQNDVDVVDIFKEHDAHVIDITHKDLLDIADVNPVARAMLKRTAFTNIREWAVVCLYQWESIPFDEFAPGYVDFDPYPHLGGGGHNLRAAMQAAKSAREAQENH